eukprot:766354_1
MTSLVFYIAWIACSQTITSKRHAKCNLVPRCSAKSNNTECLTQRSILGGHESIDPAFVQSAFAYNIEQVESQRTFECNTEQVKSQHPFESTGWIPAQSALYPPYETHPLLFTEQHACHDQYTLLASSDASSFNEDTAPAPSFSNCSSTLPLLCQLTVPLPIRSTTPQTILSKRQLNREAKRNPKWGNIACAAQSSILRGHESIDPSFVQSAFTYNTEQVGSQPTFEYNTEQVESYTTSIDYWRNRWLIHTDDMYHALQTQSIISLSKDVTSTVQLPGFDTTSFGL